MYKQDLHRTVYGVPHPRSSFSVPLHVQWRDADGIETRYLRCPKTVSHHFPESAGMSADTFIHTAALFQSALTFGRVQTIAASTYKVLVREPGITSSLTPNQSNEV